MLGALDILHLASTIRTMRPFSILLAGAYLAGHAVTAFLLVFWATFPFENQAAVAGGALLVWGLTVSEHSDGKVFLWGTAVELTGLAAVALARADHTLRPASLK